MNDLESIILSLFDDGYTKSEIASLLDENLAKASSETEKAKHDALITEDAANVYAAMVKYYADKYNDPTFMSTSRYSTADIIGLLDSLYFDASGKNVICETDLNDVYDTLKGYFTTEHDDPTFMDDQCPTNRLKQYLDSIYSISKCNEFSLIDDTLKRIQAASYDYWYYTHNNTEIEITPEEITYILESYYGRDHVETMPELLRNIAELLNTYFMRTRKGYHGKEIYEWFPTPDDFAAYLNTFHFPSNNPFDDVKDDDIYDLLAQAVDTFLAKTVEDYEPGTLTEMFPEPKNIGDYVITLYKTYKYFKNLGLDGKNDFSDILNLLFK